MRPREPERAPSTAAGDADAARRLEAMLAAGELADGAAPLEEVVARALDLVVPAIAGACVLHWERDGTPELVGVRVAGAGGPALEERIRALAAAPGGAPRHDEPVLLPDLSRADLALLGGLNPVAAAAVPLRRAGRVTGQLTVASRSADEPFDGDLRFLSVLAGRLAVALDNAALGASGRQLEALVRGMGDAVTVRDPEGRILFANDAAVELSGAASLDELRAMPFEAILERFAIYDADGRPLGPGEVSWARALEEGRATAPALVRRVDKRTGRQAWLSSKASVVRDNRGRTAMVVNVTEDVTEARRAEIGQRLLVEAGRRLSATTDLAATLQEVAELTVPTLADWCGIDLPGAGGFLRQVGVAHLDPAKVELAQRLRARHPVRVDDEGASARVIRTGEPVLMSDITPEMLRAAAEDPEHLALLEGLGLSALLIAPLRTGDDVLGTLSLVASQPHRRFDDADLEVADALGRRIADALRNDRLLRDRVEMARVLSAGLRPEARRCSPAARSPRSTARPASTSRRAATSTT